MGYPSTGCFFRTSWFSPHEHHQLAQRQQRHEHLAVAVQRGAVQRRAAGRVLGVLQAAEGQVLGVGWIYRFPKWPWFPKNGMKTIGKP